MGIRESIRHQTTVNAKSQKKIDSGSRPRTVRRPKHAVARRSAPAILRNVLPRKNLRKADTPIRKMSFGVKMKSENRNMVLTETGRPEGSCAAISKGKTHFKILRAGRLSSGSLPQYHEVRGEKSKTAVLEDAAVWWESKVVINPA
jgi:hypothetical protein